MNTKKALRIAAVSFGASALSLLLGFLVYSAFELHVSAVTLHVSTVEWYCKKYPEKTCPDTGSWNGWVYRVFAKPNAVLSSGPRED